MDYLILAGEAGSLVVNPAFVVRLFGLHEGFSLLGFNLDPGVVHVSEPMAQCCSFEVVQCSTFHFLHVQVGHNRRQQGAYGPLGSCEITDSHDDPGE